ncbi:hypothetical protein L6R49_09260 [Myxococcota bacterium]|nr:hypothetical protein [Myxococcota bacterium]
MSASSAVAGLLTDGRRGWVWLGCVLFAGALVFAHGERVSRREAELVDCAANPGRCPGRKAFLALVEVVSVDATGFVVLKQTNALRIDGVVPDLRPGETISVIAAVQPGGLGLLSVERHPWRGLKRSLGLVGLGLTGLVMALGLRLRGGRLVERG